jgi:hypothetical protein
LLWNCTVKCELGWFLTLKPLQENCKKTPLLLFISLLGKMKY